MRWREVYEHLANIDRWTSMLGDTHEARYWLLNTVMSGIHPRCIAKVDVAGRKYELSIKRLGRNDPRVRLNVSVKSAGLRYAVRMGAGSAWGNGGYHVGRNP
jgi:hypothetical protein